MVVSVENDLANHPRFYLSLAFEMLRRPSSCEINGHKQAGSLDDDREEAAALGPIEAMA